MVKRDTGFALQTSLSQRQVCFAQVLAAAEDASAATCASLSVCFIERQSRCAMCQLHVAFRTLPSVQAAASLSKPRHTHSGTDIQAADRQLAWRAHAVMCHAMQCSATVCGNNRQQCRQQPTIPLQADSNKLSSRPARLTGYIVDSSKLQQPPHPGRLSDTYQKLTTPNHNADQLGTLDSRQLDRMSTHDEGSMRAFASKLKCPRAPFVMHQLFNLA